jgi:hypothetical protein
VPDGIFVTGAGTADGAGKLYEVILGGDAGVLGGTELLVAGADGTAGATEAGVCATGTIGAGAAGAAGGA